MKVVLIYPDMADITEIFNTKTVAKLRPQFPLGIHYIAASLINEGIDCAVLDANLEGLDNQNCAERILSKDPTAVGFSVTCLNLLNANRIAELIKRMKPDSTIVFGGPQATIMPEEVMKNHCVDYLVVGEGEITFVDLLRSIENGNNDRDATTKSRFGFLAVSTAASHGN